MSDELLATKEKKPSSHKNGNVEIERRFEVRRLPKNLEQYDKKELQSGYFRLGERKFFRIRHDGNHYSLVYKRGNGVRRVEISFPLTEEEFHTMWPDTDNTTRTQKTRYFVPYDGKTWELNIYQGKKRGRMNVEIELDAINEAVNRPDWVGREVTLAEKLVTNPNNGNGTSQTARNLLRKAKKH